MSAGFSGLPGLETRPTATPATAEEMGTPATQSPKIKLVKIWSDYCGFEAIGVFSSLIRLIVLAVFHFSLSTF